MSEDIALDDVDLAIIEVLRSDGRATNQQIALQLGLNASTISVRIRRMEQANKLRVVVVSDFAAHGYNILVPLAIEVHGRPVLDVANDLTALPEVFALHIVTGPHDIDALLTLQSHEDAADFVYNKLSKIPGIRSAEPSIAIDVLKYKFDVAPIVDTGPSA